MQLLLMVIADRGEVFHKTGRLCNEDTWNETASVDNNLYGNSLRTAAMNKLIFFRVLL